MLLACTLNTQYIEYIGSLFRAMVRYFVYGVLFRSISLDFVFRQSLVPQKGPHGMHIIVVVDRLF